jgi:pimeloyl-ACP methyl ester carboxylesterase
VGVLGWSMGGAGALRLAEAAPERLAAVVATSPAVATAGEEVAGAARLACRRVRVDCGQTDPFADATRALAAKLPEGAEVNLAKAARRPVLAAAGPCPAPLPGRRAGPLSDGILRQPR